MRMSFARSRSKAARTGKHELQVIEESLRRDLGVDDLAEIWAKVTPAPEDEGLELAGDELRAMHRESRGEAGS
jgi:hypothetical protein